MKKCKRFCHYLIAIMISAFSIAHAQTVKVYITSDNAYVFGFGNVNGINVNDYHAPGVCNTSAAEIYNAYPGTETYTINNANLNGKYIYIAAWSDEDRYQGLIAQFTDGTNTILTGPNPSSSNPNIAWEVYATGMNLYPTPIATDPDPSAANSWQPIHNANCPSIGNINSQISMANSITGGSNSSKGWVKDPSFTAFNAGKIGVLAIGPTNTPGSTHTPTSPFPPATVQNIDLNAHWIWYYPSSPIPNPTTTKPFISPAPVGEYFIFRVGPLDSIFSQSNIGCCPELPNLIKNPAFDQPQSQKISEYIWIGTEMDLLPGYYNILDGGHAHAYCDEWSVQDHTSCSSTSGRFLVVNGETTQPSNINNVIWKQTVTGIEIGSTYRFCVNLKNLPACCFDVKPKIQIGVTPGGIMATKTIDVNASNPCEWDLVDFTFQATSTSVTIKIFLDETGKGDGNDLAIDDIALVKLPPVPNQFTIFNLAITPAPSPNSSLYNITATQTPGLDFTYECGYFWEVCQLDQNGQVIPATLVQNASAWWTFPAPCTFVGYNGTTTLSGTGPGLFDLDGKKYRITYGVFCKCSTWNASSYTWDPMKREKGKPPVFIEDKNYKLSSEAINKIINSKNRPSSVTPPQKAGTMFKK